MQKREQKEFYFGTDLISKRSEWTALKQELAAKAETGLFLPKKKLVVDPKQLKLKKSRPVQSDDEDDDYSDSDKSPIPKRYGGLDLDQIKCIEFFMLEVDKLLSIVSNKENKDPRRDEDLITLMALRQFVARYFAGDSDSDNIYKIMRSKIKVSEMIMVLSSLKFKDKNPDMILVTVKQFTDIFLELVVNPASFKASQINFYRGGKCIINIFIFLIKSFFQQSRIMRSIYSDDFMKNEVVHLFCGKEILELLKVIVDSTIELAAVDFGQPISSSHQTSAFQLHSNKNSQAHEPLQQPLKAGQNGDQETQALNLSLDKTQFHQSLLLRSGQGKTAPVNQYSFELGRDLNSSDRNSHKGDLFAFKNEDSLPQNSMPFGGMEIPIAGNFNSFVSNLLKKKPTEEIPKKK